MAPNAVLQSAFIKKSRVITYTSATAYFPATTFWCLPDILLLILKPLTGQYAIHGPLARHTARIALTKLPVLRFFMPFISSPLAYSCFTAAQATLCAVSRDWRHHADLLYLYIDPMRC